MKRQYTGWGYIDWFDFGKEGEKGILDVGIVTISPHAHMSAHIHFTEQVLYMLQGSGYSIIKKKQVDMKPGTMLHWKAGIIHEMYNTGDVDFKHLMISCPDQINLDSLQKGKLKVQSEYKITSEKAHKYLYIAIEGIRTQFLDNLVYSYAIFDSFGNLMTKSRLFPEFCRKHCGKQILAGTAPCFRAKLATANNVEGQFICENGLTVLTVPIVFRGIFLGYIQGGFLHVNPPADDEDENYYVQPTSSVLGIQMLLRRITKAVVNFCEFYEFKQELIEKNDLLVGNQHCQELLAANLKNAESTMTDLKINNHFLFNTLNQMASMALDNGQVNLYQSIIDLSKMFNYSLRNNSSIVPLSKEMDYLESYLKLQKLRYGEQLKLDYNLDKNLKEISVPFNFLMPIAENAFVHGFHDEKRKKFCIKTAAKGDCVEIQMSNNGKKLSPDDCKRINYGMRSNTTHGLSLIYSKLLVTYGENFTFEISTSAAGETELYLLLPREPKKGERIC